MFKFATIVINKLRHCMKLQLEFRPSIDENWSDTTLAVFIIWINISLNVP